VLGEAEVTETASTAAAGNETSTATPLLEAVEAHARSGLISFHMPGHKAGSGSWAKLAETWRGGGLAWDLTELPGLGNLHLHNGPIGEAERLLSDLYGSGESFFLVNGSSVGVHILITTTAAGGKIALARNAHLSAYSACVIAGAMPVPVPVEVDPLSGLPGVARPEVLAGVLDAHPDCQSSMVVSPTFYGATSDIASLVDVAHDHGSYLVVDEAHGPHLGLAPGYPAGALSLGADACVQSPHKVLGSLTQTAWLHLSKNVVQNGLSERVRAVIDVLQSTSPSYLLMSSLDMARQLAATTGRQDWEKAARLSIWAAREMSRVGARIHGYESVTGEDAVPGTWDWSKLTFSLAGLGWDGLSLAQYLREHAHVQVESADLLNVVAILTPADTEESVGRMVAGVRGLAGMEPTPDAKQKVEDGYRMARWLGEILGKPQPPVMPPREAFFARQRRRLPLEEAIGHISGQLLAPYPPGVPVLVWGEEITPEKASVLGTARRYGWDVFGSGGEWDGTVLVVD